MKNLPFQHHDPQGNGVKYLEDLALVSWYSEILCTAIELEIFSLLEPNGKTATEIITILDIEPVGAELFLEALCTLGLLGHYGEIYFNSVTAQDFLVKERMNYLGDSLLTRPFLTANGNGLTLCQHLQKVRGIKLENKQIGPKTQNGIAGIAQTKGQVNRALKHLTPSTVQEILPIFADQNLKGNVLAMGSGAEAITQALLAHFPMLQATFLGSPESIDSIQKQFDLIIFSNQMVENSLRDFGALLNKLELCLKPDGLLLIHDTFREQDLQKAALLDLNLWTNNIQGQVISAKWVREQLEKRQFSVSELVALSSDTALLVAAKDTQTLQGLSLDCESQLIARIKRLGFDRAQPIFVRDVQIPGWTDLRCRYGCSSYGQPQCSPDRNTAQKTKETLAGFTRGLLLEGTPPTRDFQRQVLKAEREAFLTGYYKALAFWAGPCTLCERCGGEEGCRNHKEARSSMESAGIDVYATVRKAGISLRTIADPRDYVKYFALLLLD